MTQYYDEKLVQGLHYQDIVVEELYKIGLPIISYSSKEFQYTIGENKAGIEIKNDTRFKDTGNFYIEKQEKSKAENKFFVNSGIYRDDNTWLYIIGDNSEFHIFSKKQLILLDKSSKYKDIEIPTSRGYLLPYNEALKFYVLKTVNIDLTMKER